MSDKGAFRALLLKMLGTHNSQILISLMDSVNNKYVVVLAESSDTTWAGEDDFVLVEATESGSAECSASSGSEAAPRPRSLALAAAPPPAPASHEPRQPLTLNRVSNTLLSYTLFDSFVSNNGDIGFGALYCVSNTV